MTCANCAQTVENGIQKLDGAKGIRVDFMSGKLHVEGDIAEDTIRQRLQALGYGIQDDTTDQYIQTRGGVLGFGQYLLKQTEMRLALIAGVIIFIAIMLSLSGMAAQTTDLMYLAAMAIAVYPIARSGLNSLYINHDFNINLLMSIAAVGAVIIGEYLEAATVIFLFSVGEALEGYVTERSRDSLRGLLALVPQRAIRLSADGTEEEVAVDELQISDIIIVKPGERVSMDGTILRGEGAIDQAHITGESIPVHKQVGDPVFAGTVNGDSALEIEVTHLAADNTLSRIIKLVEETRSAQAPSQRMIDNFARFYTPAVVVTAFFVATVPPLLFNAPFYDTADSYGWFYRALSLLVISCPCALVISTPVTIISAITSSARRGILIKGGAHLESLGRIKMLAFDKTGTLTRGQPIVVQVRSSDCPTPHLAKDDCDDCEQCDDLLAIASAVERRSAHPLAQAVVNAANERHLDEVYAPAQAVASMSGRGVQGQINGQQVTIGSHQLFDEDYPHDEDMCDLVNNVEKNGQTAMMLHDGHSVRGFIAVADEPRATSKQAVTDLKAMGLATVMLTGDNQTVAAAVGTAVGVDDVRAGLLPEDKVSEVDKLLKLYGDIGMVGDGVNDAPALASASVGVAMGGAGSAQAMETADIALMADDLSQLPYAIKQARFARRLIRQNIALSLVMKLGLVTFAIGGLTTMWMAVLADVGMLLVVTLNGMRPLRMK